MENFYVITCVTALIGAIIQGMSGFAFSIIMLMVMPYFLPYTEALALVAITSTIMVIGNLYQYRKHIVWKRLFIPILVFGGMDILSVGLLKHTETNTNIIKLLGVAFIILALYLNFGQGKIYIKPTLRNAVLLNAVGGLVNGLFGIAGPIVVLYFMAVSDEKDEYMSTLQVFFFVTIIVDVAVRLWHGMVTMQIMQYSLYCLVFIVLGLYIGKKIFDRVDINILYKIVYGVMVINGLVLIIS